MGKFSKTKKKKKKRGKKKTKKDEKAGKYPQPRWAWSEKRKDTQVSVARMGKNIEIE